MTLLSGEKIRLRPLEDDDIKDYFKWWNDPKLTGNYLGFHPTSLQLFEKFTRETGEGVPLLFFIIEKLGNPIKKIGVIDYSPIDIFGLDTYRIGLNIYDLDERGKGYAKEALKLAVDFLFMTKNVERIEAETDIENIPAQKALEVQGFKREGILRKRRFNNGHHRDQYIYSILREDWLENRGNSF